MAQTAHIEVIDYDSTPGQPVMPRSVLIDGVEYWTAENEPITISPITGDALVTVNLTLIVSGVTLRHAE